MKFFITAETTIDVTHAELSVLFDFEALMNPAASDLEIEGIDHIGIVVVIMNPEIAPPFPAGIILRRARRELDIKPAVDFTTWGAADRRGRIELVVEAVSVVLSDRPKKGLADEAIAVLVAAFRRGYRDFELN